MWVDRGRSRKSADASMCTKGNLDPTVRELHQLREWEPGLRRHPNPQPRRMEKKESSQAAAARKQEKRKERRLRDKERRLVIQKTKQEEKKRRRHG